MRNLKRALSLALATVMTLGLMVVGTGAVGYEDVTSEDNVEAIEVLQAVGIMTGDENGNFNPDNTVTRNEMAVIMSQLLNLDYNYYRGTNPFTDVPQGHWAGDAVQYVYENNLMGGTDSTTFSPNNTTTRGMIVTVLYRLTGEPASGTASRMAFPASG